jgi:hypothetical protein
MKSEVCGLRSEVPDKRIEAGLMYANLDEALLPLTT